MTSQISEYIAVDDAFSVVNLFFSNIREGRDTDHLSAQLAESKLGPAVTARIPYINETASRVRRHNSRLADGVVSTAIQPVIVENPSAGLQFGIELTKTKPTTLRPHHQHVQYRTTDLSYSIHDEVGVWEGVGVGRACKDRVILDADSLSRNGIYQLGVKIRQIDSRCHFEEAIVIAANTPKNYFHNVYHCLAAAHQAAKETSWPIIIPACAPSVIKPLWTLLGNDLGQLVILDTDVTVGSCVVVRGNGGSVRRSLASDLRARLATSGPTPRRLYLNRLDTSRRQLLNEVALQERLISEGFESYSPGELPITEQLRLAIQAETIVAPHGAGMTNILTAQLGANVLELTVPHWPNQTYKVVSAVMGFRYSTQPGESVMTGPRSDSWEIDVESVLQHVTTQAPRIPETR